MKRRNSDEECEFCDRIWGVFGVATGALILLIGLDLLSGGTIGRLVGKPNARVDSGVDYGEESEYEDESEYADE